MCLNLCNGLTAFAIADSLLRLVIVPYPIFIACWLFLSFNLLIGAIKNDVGEIELATLPPPAYCEKVCVSSYAACWSCWRESWPLILMVDGLGEEAMRSLL